MLLIYPPFAKNCEPPAGIAQLAGALLGNNIQCTLLDANHEAFHYLLKYPADPQNTWSRRAVKNIARNIASLQSSDIFRSLSQYKRAVADLNRVLEITGKSNHLNLSLANYQDDSLAPVKSDDLLHAAQYPERNIFFPYFNKRLEQMIYGEQPRLIGFSLNYLSQALTTFAMIGFLKKYFSEIPIVVGGGLITSWMHNPVWNNPFSGLVDHLIDGPGELPLLKLLNKTDNPLHAPPDFNQLPIHGYLSPGFILPYAASSGCYWNKCSFCPEKAEKNPYSNLPEQVVTNDIRILKNTYNPVLLHLLDNAISPALMKSFSNNPPGLPWYSFARISPLLTDQDFCMKLRKSGCVMIKLGLESGSQEVLDTMHKGIDLIMAAKALSALHRAGIATYIYLLFGTPAETLAQAQKTLEFTVLHHQTISFLNLAIFNMPVCSTEAANITAKNFYEGDLSLYTDFIHPKGWNRKLVRQFLSQEFKKHPAVATIIKRDPPFFTSNHAPFFNIDRLKIDCSLVKN